MYAPTLDGWLPSFISPLDASRVEKRVLRVAAQGRGQEAALLLPDTGRAPLRLRRAVGEVGGEGGEILDSCTILTAEANEVLRPVHDRMPVIVHPKDYGLWLQAGERERASPK